MQHLASHIGMRKAFGDHQALIILFENGGVGHIAPALDRLVVPNALIDKLALRVKLTDSTAYLCLARYEVVDQGRDIARVYDLGDLLEFDTQIFKQADEAQCRDLRREIETIAVVIDHRGAEQANLVVIN